MAILALLRVNRQGKEADAVSNRRSPMRSIREVARLHFEFGLSAREIARSVNLGSTTVWEILARFDGAHLNWPLPSDLSDSALEELLYPPSRLGKQRPEPDWSYVHRELRRQGVTLRLLWVDYKADHPDGLGYSQFCARYEEIVHTKEVSMRQSHPAGERMFVDYAGMTLPIIERATGQIREAQVFVATLGASGYTYAEATWTQNLEDFTGSQARAFQFFGGVTKVITPDNLKGAVTRADYYDPQINPTYAEFARHYGVAIIPARVRKPKDKSKVERNVLLVEQAVLAPLRNVHVFTLAQANSAIGPLLHTLNHRKYQRLDDSRYSLFLSVDKPVLRPLPASAFECARWRKARINVDYHVEVERCYYSVPYVHVHKEADVRISERTVEIFLKGERIASHPRMHRQGQFSTLDEHMPSAHRRYKNRKPSQLLEEARRISISTAALSEEILRHRSHPEQGYRTLLGILRLGTSYPAERMEAAAKICLQNHIYSSHGMRLILHNSTDRIPQPDREAPDVGVGSHKNVRGPGYFSSPPLSDGR